MNIYGEDEMSKKIGIVKEKKNAWERRVPLIPSDVQRLIAAQDVEIIVQPSNQRIFPDVEFENAGAILKDDLSACDLIFGIKEVKIGDLIRGKTYLYFSHTIKGQPYNMPMLKKILDLKCTLLDYERMVDEKNQRLIYFSYHAGVAGTIDSFWAYGQRLVREQISSPFMNINQTFRYQDQAAAESAFADLGKQINKNGLPGSIRPLVIGITGYGNVSRGVQHMLSFLPLEKIKPDDLTDFHRRHASIDDRIVQVIFREEDMFKRLETEQPFNLQEYYRNPEKYRADFERYLPELDILINASFWDSAYPRHVTKDALRRLFTSGQRPRLRVIGDISCDVQGGIECTVRVTDPGNPVYVYQPSTDSIRDGVAGEGPVIMAVDNLPSELPKDASLYFSSVLKTIVPDLLAVDWRVSFDDLRLPEALKKAVIVHQGRLTDDYRYLADYL